MKKKIDLKGILKKNPNINVRDLEKYRILSEELRKTGLKPRDYQLATPYSLRNDETDNIDEVDQRTLNLTTFRH